MIKIIGAGIAAVVLFLPSLLFLWKNRRLKLRLFLYNAVLVVGLGIVEIVLLQFGFGAFCEFMIGTVGVLLLSGWAYLSYWVVNH